MWQMPMLSSKSRHAPDFPMCLILHDHFRALVLKCHDQPMTDTVLPLRCSRGHNPNDPHVVSDLEAGRWRRLLAQRHHDHKASFHALPDFEESSVVIE